MTQKVEISELARFIDKYGYIRGVLIYNGCSPEEVLAMTDEDAIEVYDHLVYFA